MPLIVLDLETTGLNPLSDDIIEVGAIVLDSCDNAIGKFNMLSKRWKQFHDIDPFVREMHMRNGLWKALELANPRTIRQVDFQLADWLADKGVRKGEGILVGASIHFDRSFIKAQMPQVEHLLSHRMRDTSALAKTLTDWGLWNNAGGEMPHRALLDCEIELVEYVAIKHHLQNLNAIAENANEAWKQGV